MDISIMGAAHKYAALRPATEPTAGQPDAQGAIRDAARDFASTLQESETMARAPWSRRGRKPSLPSRRPSRCATRSSRPIRKS